MEAIISLCVSKKWKQLTYPIRSISSVLRQCKVATSKFFSSASEDKWFSSNILSLKTCIENQTNQNIKFEESLFTDKRRELAIFWYRLSIGKVTRLLQLA